MLMNANVKSILTQALSLNSKQRIAVAEKLLSSLDVPDPVIDQIWSVEVEARIDAYERDEIEAVAAESVFGKYETRWMFAS